MEELSCDPCPKCPEWPRCFRICILVEIGEVAVCKAIYLDMLRSIDVPLTE